MIPLATICIPTYNSARYIEETVRAALASSYENLEVLVVDDGSADATVAIVQAIKDPRVRLVVNERNLGMTGNWNRCIELSRGEYVKLIPADDIVYPDCMKLSVELLRANPSLSMVITGIDLINEESKKIGSYMLWRKEGIVAGRRIAKAGLFNNYYGNPVGVTFRKEDYFRTGGFDPDIPYILDFDLWLGLSKLGDVYVYPKKLAGFRVRKDSNSGMLMGKYRKAYTLEHKRVFEKHAALGTYSMNGFEKTLAVWWRSLRSFLIALFIRVKG